MVDLDALRVAIDASPSAEWLRALIDEVKTSRLAVASMERVLTEVKADRDARREHTATMMRVAENGATIALAERLRYTTNSLKEAAWAGFRRSLILIGKDVTGWEAPFEQWWNRYLALEEAAAIDTHECGHAGGFEVDECPCCGR